jgi:hypothetical protein
MVYAQPPGYPEGQPCMTPENHNGPDDSDDERYEHRDYLDDDPMWLPQAEPTAAADYYEFTLRRPELISRIGDEVGFSHDPEKDRLNKEQLAMILVFAKVHNENL